MPSENESSSRTRLVKFVGELRDNSRLRRSSPTVEDLAVRVLRDKYVIVVVFDGGRTARANLTDFAEVVQKALADDVPADSMEMVDVPPEDKNFGANTNSSTYAPPFVLAIYVPDTAVRTLLLTIVTCPVDNAHAFHLVAPDPAVFPWVIGIWECGSPATNPEVLRALRAAISLLLWEDAAIGQRIDQLMQTADTRPLIERRYELSRSVDPRWNPLMKAWVVFARPCTTDAESWDRFVAMIHGRNLHYSRFSFKPMLDPLHPKIGPICVECKNSTYFSQGCGYSKDSNPFWGPPNQINQLKEGKLARKPDNRSGQDTNRSGNNGGGYRKMLAVDTVTAEAADTAMAKAAGANAGEGPDPVAVHM
ncbi:hypothetical protein B0H19DRAFT_1377894 [Mycena capillaripes]|nr:hypothetical protein B0H19DRAFT_1377894 [Mycena capillaripes]